MEFIQILRVLDDAERTDTLREGKTLADHRKDLDLAREGVREAVSTLERRVNDELSFVSKKDPPTPLGTIYAQVERPPDR